MSIMVLLQNQALRRCQVRTSEAMGRGREELSWGWGIMLVAHCIQSLPAIYTVAGIVYCSHNGRHVRI